MQYFTVLAADKENIKREKLFQNKETKGGKTNRKGGEKEANNKL